MPVEETMSNDDPCMSGVADGVGGAQRLSPADIGVPIFAEPFTAIGCVYVHAQRGQSLLGLAAVAMSGGARSAGIVAVHCE